VSTLVSAKKGERILASGNEAVARGAWEAGAAVCAAYPGTPSTEILENVALFPDLYAEWSVNEKVALEVAIGASLTGARGFAAMKQVGLNVASDPMMSQTLAGVIGGLVIAVADDIGISSSQNEQDSRYWGRFGHMPVLEPADSDEARRMVGIGFEISEKFQVPVILRLTTRICHVKGMITCDQRTEKKSTGFHYDPNRWVMTPNTAKLRLPHYHERDGLMRAEAEDHPLNQVESGPDASIGFVTSGTAYMGVKEAFPDAPVLKLGFSHPLPVEMIRRFAATVETLVSAEEVEPLVEMELKANGIPCHGKDCLPKRFDLSPDVLRRGIAELRGEAVADVVEVNKTIAVTPKTHGTAGALFPRPPVMCPGCPHLGVGIVLHRLRKNLTILGDIGCYALMSGPPWDAMDTAVCMGSSMGLALGVDKGRGEADPNKRIVGVIGDSTFLHTGMPGLLDIVYNRGNVTVIIADNRAVGMTGGQDHPGSGRDIRGNEAPRVDFSKLAEALGVNPERVHTIDPYELPTLMKAVRQETKIPEPSVIVTNEPCVLMDYFNPRVPLIVDEEACTGCGKCLDVGCPIITVTRRGKEVKNSGREVDLAWVRIDETLCTGCNLCLTTCGPKAIVPVPEFKPPERPSGPPPVEMTGG